MCQAYEGERAYVVSSELREIQRKWAAHEDGTKPLTEEQMRDLAVEKLMLLEA